VARKKPVDPSMNLRRSNVSYHAPCPEIPGVLKKKGKPSPLVRRFKAELRKRNWPRYPFASWYAALKAAFNGEVEVADGNSPSGCYRELHCRKTKLEVKPEILVFSTTCALDRHQTWGRRSTATAKITGSNLGHLGAFFDRFLYRFRVRNHPGFYRCK
jgi:hypothetical protein